MLISIKENPIENIQICISNYVNPNNTNVIYNLTKGKKYTIQDVHYIPFHPSRGVDIRGPFYKLEDDANQTIIVLYDMFRDLTLEEIRDLKLNQLI